MKWIDSIFSEKEKSLPQDRVYKGALFGVIASSLYAAIFMVLTFAAITVSILQNQSQFTFDNFGVYSALSLAFLVLGFCFLIATFAITAKKADITSAVVASAVFFALSIILVPLALVITTIFSTTVLFPIAPYSAPIID